jgi:hypothetical protein
MNKLNSTLLIELQSIGNISVWATLVKYSNVVFEQYERFQKSGFRNRYQILSASGPLTLSIPVIGGRKNKLLIKEVLVDNSTYWQKHHWRGLESCYNKSPFFFHYRHIFQPIFEQKFRWLWDFNTQIFEANYKILKLGVIVGYTDRYEKQYPENEVMDLRNRATISNRLEFLHEFYPQVFGNDFVRNLSLFDLLFNLGPESGYYLKNQGN